MPDYTIPGAYVEETSTQAHRIEGVGTATAGLVGPAAFGPVGAASVLLTSLGDYERLYGGGPALAFAEGAAPDYLWHAVRAFFTEGGTRLFVSRIYRPAPSGGCAAAAFGAFQFRARYPGSGGDGGLSIDLALSPTFSPNEFADRDVIHVASGDHAGFHLVMAGAAGWSVRALDAAPDEPGIPLQDLAGTDPRKVTATATFQPAGGGALAYSGLALDPQPGIAGAWTLGACFPQTPPSNGDASPPLVLSAPEGADGLDVVRALLTAGAAAPGFAVAIDLAGGDDGSRPTAGDYEQGLAALEPVDEIAVVAAPGSSDPAQADAQVVAAALVAHAEKMRFRIALVDSVLGHDLAEVQAWRANFDSSRAALYYPWIRVADPALEAGILLPPSGFVAGLYSRSDVDHAVFKAPANMVVGEAAGVEVPINKAQQDVLNPLGINCFRFFEGRGYRLWGARTLSSDPELKYVGAVRYLAYIERSLTTGLQWTVFEPPGEPLWAQVRAAAQDFLMGEWQAGGLFGAAIDQAAFVKCDASTMTTADIAAGRLILLVGLALERPAEFTLIRIAIP